MNKIYRQYSKITKISGIHLNAPNLVCNFCILLIIMVLMYLVGLVLVSQFC